MFHSVFLILYYLLFLSNYQSLGDKILSRHKRIIGGNIVSEHSYPWIVSIQGRHKSIWKTIIQPVDEQYCGAALIKPNWLLTAAHCLYAESKDSEELSFINPKLWHVRLATNKLTPNLSERFKGLFKRLYNAIFGYVKPQTFYHVEKIFPHPKYNPGFLEYDIALFKLKETPILSKFKHLALINLPNATNDKQWPTENQECTAVGWGCTVADGPPNMNVKSIMLPVLSPEVCQKMYAANINLTIEHEFCAGYFKKGVGICPGDSGGPLVCSDSTGQMQLAGIVSARHAQFPEEYPGIFTRVSYFIDWINEVIKKNPTKPKINLMSIFNIKN